jgi:tRNA threonylcarbamoyladenosine biosynthesis protein TsaB
MSGPGILGFDTATADTAVAVTNAGGLVAERRDGPGPGDRPSHAAVLLEEVEACVGEAGGWPGIDLIAVGIGPGTFTGLRVGIATARALGQARRLPVAPVSSLEALALGIGDRAPDRSRLVLIDARRGEAFAALYDASGAELIAPAALSPADIVSRLADVPQTPVAAGDGSLRFREQLESAGVDVPPGADPAHRMAGRQICRLAAEIEPGPAIDVRPAYLRRPDAEVWREQRNRDPGPG